MSVLQIWLTLLALFVATTIVCWLIYIPIIARGLGYVPPRLTGGLRHVLPGESCEFTTRDGVVLRGSYLRSSTQHRQGVVAFCHENSGDRWTGAPYMVHLLEAGFDVLLFDFRGHGQSDAQPNYKPMIWPTQFEAFDVLAAVDYLCSRPDADGHGIGLMGVSRGASVALCAAAQDRRIMAVITDGAYPLDKTMDHYIRRYWKNFDPLYWLWSSLPKAWVFNIYVKPAQRLRQWRNHCRFLDPADLAASIEQPVFMIHGARDPSVPPELARALRGRIRGRTKLWLVPKAKHNQSIHVASDEYIRRVRRFLGRYLASELRWRQARQFPLHEQSVLVSAE